MIDQRRLVSRLKLLLERGERVSTDDCLTLFDVSNLVELARLARIPRERRFGRHAYIYGGSGSHTNGAAMEYLSVAALYGDAGRRPIDHARQLEAVREQQDADVALDAVSLSAVDNADALAQNLFVPTAIETLRMCAISRIYLDNIAHIMISPSLVGLEIAVISLSYGADSLDVTPVSPQTSSPDEHDVESIRIPVVEIGHGLAAEQLAMVKACMVESRWDVRMIECPGDLGDRDAGMNGGDNAASR